MSAVAFYKCRVANRLPGFIAWATLVPMTDLDPVREPAEPLWFDFGTTEEQAIAKVQKGVEDEIGKVEWKRQEA